jgi:hypothetical protein
VGTESAQVAALDDEARVLQSDHGDERPDPDADGQLQVKRDRGDDPLAQAEDDEGDDHRSVDHEDPHHRRPADAVGSHLGRGVGVQTEAGSQRERVAREHAHGQRQNPPAQRRDGQHLGKRQPHAIQIRRGTQHGRVDEDDVDEREECGQPPDQLRAVRAAAGADLKPTIQQPASVCQPALQPPGRGRSRFRRISQAGRER